MKHTLMTLFLITVAFSISIFAQSSSQVRKDSSARDYTFTIKASPAWTDTGIILNPGDRIHIYGPITACEGRLPNETEHLLLESAPAGALLAKLELEAGAVSASPDADLPVIEPSHLYLAVNGWQCHGTISARVQVSRKH
jgi:hypothetical protein